MYENNTYSLWIMPEGAAYNLTNSYIAKLSGVYNLPKFEPHVTILGRIHSSDTSTLRGLAASLPPFRIRLNNQPEYLDEYFRCLFLKVHETAELMKTFSRASELFSYKGTPYFPHLSLAYGNLPISTKQEMIYTLGDIPQIDFEACHLSLVLASTQTPVSSWRVVERFPLSSA